MVHYFGQPQNIDLFIKFSKMNNLILVEDNAHGFGGKWNGRELGTFGEIGICSPRKFLNTKTGGILYLDGQNIDPPEYGVKKSKLFEDQIRTYFKKHNWAKFTAYKTIGRLPSFVSNAEILEPEQDDLLANEFATIKINKILKNKKQLELIAKIRRDKWAEFNYELRNFEINVVYSSLNQESSPWAYPLYVNNTDEKNKIIKHCLGKKIIVFPWPYIDKKLLMANSKFITRWEKLICIPLD